MYPGNLLKNQKKLGQIRIEILGTPGIQVEYCSAENGHLPISPASFTLTHQSSFENNSKVPRPRYSGLPDLCFHWSGVCKVR